MDALLEKAEAAVSVATPEGRLLLLADLRQAVDAAMVAALGEIDAAPGPILLDGAIDGGRWLAARSDLHPAEASALAGLARALPVMPATTEALEEGRIGVEKARLLQSAREVDEFPAAEAGLVERITDASLRTARRIIRRFIADHHQPAATDAADNEVTLTRKRNGRWHLAGDLDIAAGALLHNELRRLAEAHRDDEDPLPLARRTALALLDIARRSLTLGQRGAGSRPELVIVADLALHGGLGDARLEDGTPLTQQAFDTLSCDATVRRLIMNGPSEVLELGRSTRLATLAQRRAAAIRDGGCVYPGCGAPPDQCDVHHIRHWRTHHGPTDLSNLCLLCRRHHTLTHAIGFTFVRRPGGSLAIHRPDGTALPWRARPAA